MTETIKVSKIGKLRIYMKTGEAIKSKSFLRKLFPKSKYLRIMDEAKQSGIMNAHVFHTHAAVQRGGKMAHHSIEGDTSGLTVCIELADERKHLGQFFKRHREILKENTVIYKEVEFWEFDS